MRKPMLVAVLAVVGAGLLATPASASFDHHFRVLEKDSPFNPTPSEKAFRFKGNLFDPRNRHDRVGRDHGLCKIKHHEALRCRATYRFNGKIGGFGHLKTKGNLRTNDNKVNVIGGSGDFNGVGGKEVFRFLNRSESKSIDKFALVR